MDQTTSNTCANFAGKDFFHVFNIYINIYPYPYCYRSFKELAIEDPAKYKNFFRMSTELFNELLFLVLPRIEKQTTNFRLPISAEIRLQITLRYLASGCSFSSLAYMFRVPQNTISTIVPEVLDALYDVLVNEYLKVYCPIDSSILVI